MTEPVFEVFAEGGSLTIEHRKENNREVFIYHHNEMDITDEGLGINNTMDGESFEQAFQHINRKYPWYALHLETVHEDYRDYVLAELVKTLNRKAVDVTRVNYTRRELEKVLKAKLEFGFEPLGGELQHITVTNLMKLTEYEYQEYTEESGLEPRLRGKYEIWTDEQCYGGQDSEIIRDKYEFQTVGILEVSGNTIIIKNESGQMKYAFSSDKFFVSTTPLLSESKRWFYKKVYNVA